MYNIPWGKNPIIFGLEDLGWLVVFYGIATLEVYLMPIPSNTYRR